MSSLERAIIICHFDGHGVATGALCARRYNIPVENIISQYPVTGPNEFHRITEVIAPGILYSATEYFILDIAINVKDPDAFIRTLHRIFNNARKLTRSYISMQMYDHHETNKQYIHMLPQFLKYIHFSSAFELSATFASPESQDELLLALIGAACDRDTSILSHPLFQERRDEILNYAAGLDVLVRSNINEAIRACYNLDFETLRRYASQVPEPDYNQVEVIGPVAVYNIQLQEGWGPKLLEKVALRYNTPYAVGYEFVSRQNQWIVRAITLWTSNAPPVRNYIQTTRTIIGHPMAPTIAATSEQDAINLMREIAQSISRNVQLSRAQETVNRAAQSFNELFNVLVDILRQQQEMYREYLTLKRRQVELLERTTGESRVRYD